MSPTPYYESVVQALRKSPVLLQHGFGSDDIAWYPKGANHHDLMVITKPAWTIPSPAGPIDRYTGVNVHLESDSAGVLVVHCELTPRQGSESRANQELIAPLLHMKGRAVRALRERIGKYDLKRFGVNLDRIRSDPADPRSLKVMGFDLRTPDLPSSEQFAARIEPVIDVLARMIDETIRSLSAADQAKTCGTCGIENSLEAQYCRRCGVSLNGCGLTAREPMRQRGHAAIAKRVFFMLLLTGLLIAAVAWTLR